LLVAVPKKYAKSQTLERQMCGTVEEPSDPVEMRGKMEKSILVLGAGGHCKVTIDLLHQLEGYHVIGILDDNTELCGSCRAGYTVLGGVDRLTEAEFAGCAFVIGTATPRARKAMWERLSTSGLEPLTLVHPGAHVSSDAGLGQGSMVAVSAVVKSGARIGRASLINTSAVVEHDCVIGDFVHIAPGACMAGCVQIEKEAFIGIGATIIESVRIGENAIVGAGAVVLKDVAPFETVVGNPARSVRKSK
jgi:sugar O-acyltransferase (sialic acid O-acetyltransferase NeuD family)